jgi:hypothetical protein
MEDCAHVVPRARCGFLFAAVFDGHSSFAAASYLSDHLYEAFSGAINEGTYGEECSVEGAALLLLASCMHPQQAAGVCTATMAAAVSYDGPLCTWLGRREGRERAVLPGGAERAADGQLHADRPGAAGVAAE